MGALDFFCAKARLAVEIDGVSHDMGDRPRRDIRRDAWLEARGVTVMRIAAIPSPPSPACGGGGGAGLMKRPMRSFEWR